MSQKSILLIGNDARLPHAFERVLLGDALRLTANVHEALEYLRSLHAEDAKPALMLVWSSIGREAMSDLISCMRSDKSLQQIPIIVLSDPSSLDEAAELASKSNVVRNSDTDKLLDVVSEHWFSDGVGNERAQRRSSCA